MIFVGYEPGSKAYRLWDPPNHKIVISSDVTFNENKFPNIPKETTTPPPTLSDRLPLHPHKMTEGKEEKQVSFVDIPKVLLLHKDLDRHPPRAALLTPRAPAPLPPPAPILVLPPQPQTPQETTPGPAGSPPVTSCQVLLPASREASRSPSPPPQDPAPAWKSSWKVPKVEDDDDEESLVTRMVSENLEDISILVEPSMTPALGTPGNPTPSSIAVSLPESYYSPESESEHSQSELSERRRSKRKEGKPVKPGTAQEANLIASKKDLLALDEAYADGVKLFISSTTTHGEPRSYREAMHPDNPDSSKWIEAVQAELRSLQDHGTWKVVP